MGKQISDAEFMTRRSDRSGGVAACWPWLGYVAPKTGYGQVNRVIDGRLIRRYAHRMAWEVAHGDIPDDMTVDHTCHTRSCVNPNHLRLLDRVEHGRVDANYRWARR